MGRSKVRKTGVRPGTQLQKVVNIEFRDDHLGGRYWEVLACGHTGHIVGARDLPASQRWCRLCPEKRK